MIERTLSNRKLRRLGWRLYQHISRFSGFTARGRRRLRIANRLLAEMDRRGID